ncbi:hypothetical protein [Pseudomonas helleri]|uniref:hypothetical protein n=1 Tax=Pseudomonas helleri TaxID=1608996 RepID=UPI003FD10099
MDVGLVANTTNDGVFDTSASVVTLADGRELLELCSIAELTVAPIIEILRDAEPGKKYRIYLRANLGGNVKQMINLIEALGRTDADVEIAIGRFAMSAAATLWLWFALDPIIGDEGEGRVVSVDPLKPAVLMYHRPRWPRGDEYYCFIDDFEDETVKESVRSQVDLFDELFYRFLDHQGISKVHAATISHNGAHYTHHLHHMKNTYDSNKDCIITLEGVQS